MFVLFIFKQNKKNWISLTVSWQLRSYYDIANNIVMELDVTDLTAFIYFTVATTNRFSLVRGCRLCDHVIYFEMDYSLFAILTGKTFAFRLIKFCTFSTVYFLCIFRDVAAAPQTPQLGGPRPTLGAQVSLKLLFGYVTIFSSADLFTIDLNCRKKLACDIISECYVILSRRILNIRLT